MSAHYGYAGKVLKIDLGSRTASEYPWNDRDRAECLGGKIMATQILQRHLTGGETAFSEENWVVISTGPLTGTGAPGSGRFDIAALSPKDDLPAFSNCGGDFGIRLKKTGYDALILTGRSERKCWLEITEDQILFHEADALWGTGAGSCRQRLEKLLDGQHTGLLCIGPAGENLVKFASVISGDHSTGRAGIGAVLGWKNVKAIAVSGNRRISLFQAEAAAHWNQKWYAALRACGAENENSSSPGCPGCPLHCQKHLHANREAQLNDLGLDAIAAADAVQWAAAQGISSNNLYEEIAFRRGIGSKLAEGAPCRKGKSGKRRGSSYGAIAKAFGLSSDDPQTDAFCRALTEAVSAAGQCMFTVNAMQPETQAQYLLALLNSVTGTDYTLDTLIRIGKRGRELEQQLLARLK